MNPFTVDTRTLADDEFGRELTVVLAVWLSLFLLGTWLLVTYGEIATSLLL